MDDLIERMAALADELEDDRGTADFAAVIPDVEQLDEQIDGLFAELRELIEEVKL